MTLPDLDEQYILLLLADGNLPTGAFVASSGFESYVAHGFMHPQAGTLDFIRSSLQSYAASVLSFLHAAHGIVSECIAAGDRDKLDAAIADLARVDQLYHTTLLNAPARRASASQGVALLTLYTKGFAPPSSDSFQSALVDTFKLLVRRGDARGHLPTCWAVLTACLGLPLDRALYLHLFLHARGLLSAAIRLNTIGPYAAQQMLLHSVRPLIDHEISTHRAPLSHSDDDILGTNPTCTWPLGEILAARHDMQHSRIFNS
ncbi:urease accessory protein UreF [Exidia glandulosa HHB12029]|uniref:Urease accessory protein UreF n=1 Tax=Exidia glandulosa HHB12029 TaxID=1314781 RepID=A0A165R1K7_EXIGL|nr:urease accessory protein UreF [Exidia glandulosa HHB12029]